MSREVPVVLCLCALVAVPVWAAEPEKEDLPAEEASEDAPRQSGITETVTVTASPILEEIAVDPFGRSIASVGERQLAELNAQDLATGLRRVPGVVISRYDAVGSYGGADGGAVFVRGLGSGRPGAEIATLVAGIPKVTGVWAHPLLDALSVDMATRIDVYKTAQPVRLGSGAFAAIDLVPKRRTEAGFEGRVAASYGSHDTSGARFEHGGRSGIVDWFVVAGRRASDGHRPNADGDVRTVFGRVGVEPAPGWSLSVLFDGEEGEAGDPGPAGSEPVPVPPRFRTTDRMTILWLEKTGGSVRGEAKAWIDDGAMHWLQWDAASAASFTTVTDFANYGLRASESVPLGGGEILAGFDLLSYGGRAREDRFDGSHLLGDFRFRDDALWAAYRHDLEGTIRVTPSLGVRYDRSREFGGFWGAEAAVVAAASWGRLHARWARASNLPGVWTAVLYEVYGQGDAFRDLRPERLDQTEIGFAKDLGPSTRVDLSVFRSVGTEALRFVPPPPTPPSFANIGGYRSSGVEAILTIVPSRGLEVFLGGTLAATEPEDLPYAPHGTFTGGLAYGTSRLRLNADVQWVGAHVVGNPRFGTAFARVDDAFLVNGRVAWRLARGPAATSGEVFVAAENLRDSSYEYRPDYPMPGRSWMAGIDWRF